MNVNVWDVAKPLERLIRSGTDIVDTELTDADITLEELAAAGAVGSSA